MRAEKVAKGIKELSRECWTGVPWVEQSAPEQRNSPV